MSMCVFSLPVLKRVRPFPLPLYLISFPPPQKTSWALVACPSINSHLCRFGSGHGPAPPFLLRGFFLLLPPCTESVKRIPQWKSRMRSRGEEFRPSRKQAFQRGSPLLYKVSLFFPLWNEALTVHTLHTPSKRHPLLPPFPDIRKRTEFLPSAGGSAICSPLSSQRVLFFSRNSQKTLKDRLTSESYWFVFPSRWLHTKKGPFSFL